MRVAATMMLLIGFVCCEVLAQRGRVVVDLRAQFLEVETIARMPVDERAGQVWRVYREIAPNLLSTMIEGVLSSMPSRLLAKDGQYAAPPWENVKYADELERAAATMAPDEVADVIMANHGRMYLQVASRRRCLQLLERHKAELLELIEADLSGTNVEDARRAFATIHAMRLSEMLERTMQIYLSGGPIAEAARDGLSWLTDPKYAKPLIADIAKNPQAIERHHLLLSSMLRDQPADPLLVGLLSSADGEVRLQSLVALQETHDAMLVSQLQKLIDDPDARVRILAIATAGTMPDPAFETLRPRLVALLGSDDVALRIESACALAQRKDAVAAPVLLAFWKQDSPPIDEGHGIRISQAIYHLTGGSNMSYSSHSWGPSDRNNVRAIAAFEAWIARNPAAR